MKSVYGLVGLLILACVIPHGMTAKAITGRVLKSLLVEISEEHMEKATRESLELGAKRLVAVSGPETADELVARGGRELLAAAATHGEEVVQLAKRLPEATRWIASHPQKALDWAARHGDDVVLLEARVPGMGHRALQELGPESVALLANAPPSEVTKLIGYAAKADSPAAKTALVTAWKRGGVQILEELDKRKFLILTGGLTLGMIRVAEGAGEAIEQIPEAAPEGIVTFADKVGTGVQWVMVVAATLITLPIALWIHRSCKKFKQFRKSSGTPPSIR